MYFVSTAPPSNGEAGRLSEVQYWCGNPSIEIVNGVIRLCEEDDAPRESVRVAPGGGADKVMRPPLSNPLEIVLCKNVPNYMGPAELCDFLCPHTAEFKYLKVLHGPRTEQYFVLIVCRADVALQLLQAKNGAPYNPFEPLKCELRYVRDLTISVTSNVDPPDRDSLRMESHMIASSATGDRIPEDRPQTADCDGCGNAPTAPISFEFVSALRLFLRYENPLICAVCLERLAEFPSPIDANDVRADEPALQQEISELADSVSVNVLCGHVFHAGCLKKWCDTTCPVCRFQQFPFQASNCDVCGSMEGMLLCLVCGFIGCRGGTGPHHALQHYEKTQHTFALEVLTQRVWDFARSGYVHRLICNRDDGKLVEVSGPRIPASDGETPPNRSLSGGDLYRGARSRHSEAHAESAGLQAQMRLVDFQESEIRSADLDGNWTGKDPDFWIAEFNLLLTTQLDSQREFYELQCRKISEEFNVSAREQRALLTELQREEDELRRTAELENANILDLQEALRRSLAEAAELKSRKVELRAKLDEWQEKRREQNAKIDAERERIARILDEQKATLENLRGQLTDLRFHVRSAGSVSARGGAEAGSMLVGDRETSRRRRGGRRR